MRELLLFRHAKSRWDEPLTEDHDRGLAPRGEQAARRMGRLVRELEAAPDLVLCSTAARARATLALALPELGAAPEITELPELYLASPDRLLAVVRAAGGAASRLMLVGHNPGLQGFTLELAGAIEPAWRASLEAGFPTAALARLELDVARWADVAFRRGRLTGLWRPRDLD